ncbi:hypothetical protein [Nonomuraea sp. NPDC050691]|uniref:hypothetical protein n=1 Tax=Nonomuraea sp. NPDC050691 TaxID=3155661 RepID=UPI0033C276E0
MIWKSLILMRRTPLRPSAVTWACSGTGPFDGAARRASSASPPLTENVASQTAPSSRGAAG